MTRAAGAAGASTSGAEAAYSPLPVRLTPGSSELRWLYVRAHRAERGSDAAAVEAAQRTLFVAAVPAGCVRPARRAQLRARRPADGPAAAQIWPGGPA